jgi:hypothetical protein
VDDPTIPMWEVIWSMNRYVIEHAGVLRIRIPHRLSEHDRTLVRYLLAKDKRGNGVERDRARKWAHN